MDKLSILIWLKNFCPKLKRTTTRTERCRLLLSVERMEFNDDHIASTWKNVVFNNGRVALYDDNEKLLETLDMYCLQKEIIRDNPNLQGTRLSRYDIKEEYGKWRLADELQSKLISAGGEAIILQEKFDVMEMAVRIHVFDPFLFTDQALEPEFKIFHESGIFRKFFLTQVIFAFPIRLPEITKI